MPSAVHSTILASTRILCTQIVVSRGTKNSSIPTFKKKTLDIDDITENNKVVSVYPHTKLLLQMTVDARKMLYPAQSRLQSRLGTSRIPNSLPRLGSRTCPRANVQLCSCQCWPPLEPRQTPFSPSKAVEVLGSVPCNKLSQHVGELVNCCTNQQSSQSLERWSGCIKRPVGLIFVLLHDQSTAVERLVFVTCVDVNPGAYQTRPRRGVCQPPPRHQVHE